jgi:two-component system, NarL family, sensor kinase
MSVSDPHRNARSPGAMGGAMGGAITAVAGICVLLVIAGMASFVVRGAPLAEIFDAWVLHNAPVGLITVVVFGAALRRQPANRAAWFFFLAGVASSIHVASMGLAHANAAQVPELWTALVDGAVAIRDVPLAIGAPFWVASSIWLVAAGLGMTLGLLYFPDGRLPSPRWRPVALLAGVGMVLATGAYAWGLRPWSPHRIVLNYLPTEDVVARTLFFVGMPALALAGMLTIASLVVRMRTADPPERRRVRPVVVTGTLFVTVMVLLYPWQPVWAVVTVPAVVLFLITVAATVARHRLFDVEVVVSRAVTAAVLGAVITLAYLGIVAGLGGLLGTAANPWLSVGATAVIAVGFEPLRRRTLAAASRLVLGARATPYEVLGELSDRLPLADSVGEVLDRVVQLLVEGTGASRAEVRARLDGGMHLTAAAGAAAGAGAGAGEDAVHADGAVRSAPVTNAGELLGELRLLAAREDRFLASDERLLQQVAATLGPVLRNARLTRELHEHIAELEASRQRLVTAHDEARRALERDIHDGAQQQLLALRLKVGLAATLAEQDGAVRAVQAIEDVAADADAAIRVLRDLARGLYPPILAEQGLEAALRARARDVPLPVTVGVHGLGRYERSVEATVYFCCLEAIHNACKHADASTLDLELTADGGDLVFVVTDDGIGFDPAATPHGTGLANIRDRLAGAGGDFELAAAPGGGTSIRGRIPTGSAAGSDRQPAASDR